MRIAKDSKGRTILRLNKAEWMAIGRQAKWHRPARPDWIPEFVESGFIVIVRNNGHLSHEYKKTQREADERAAELKLLHPAAEVQVLPDEI